MVTAEEEMVGWDGIEPPNPGKIFTINYDLTKNAAPAHDWEDAQKYVFKCDGNRNYVDLYRRS